MLTQRPNTGVVVLFSSALHTPGGCLILTHLNSLQNNLTYPNTAYLNISTPVPWCPATVSFSTADPIPAPFITQSDNLMHIYAHTQGCDKAVQNRIPDPSLLILPGCNLHACCTVCHQKNPGTPNGGLPLSDSNEDLCITLQLVGHHPV